MAISDNRAFDMMTVAADKTAVDLFPAERMFPKDIQTVTDEDRKTWRNFSERLGSFDPIQKRQLKELWIEGGRPTIEIEKKDSARIEGKSDKNRAWYGRMIDPKAETRDILHVYEHQLVGDFMAEISHGRQYARRSEESVDDWKARRIATAKRFRKAREDFGENVYGGWMKGSDKDYPANEDRGERGWKQWFPYMGSSRKYSIGRDAEGNEVAVDDEGNVYPDMEVPQPEYRYNKKGEISGSSRNIGWAFSQAKEAIYDPERRKGFDEQRGKWIRPTTEFEAHNIIEDSLWGDFVKRFGKEWDEYGVGWVSEDWRSDEKRDALQDLIKQVLVQ